MKKHCANCGVDFTLGETIRLVYFYGVAYVHEVCPKVKERSTPETRAKGH